MKQDIHQVLLRYWGYTEFRSLQEDIIRSVMKGKDTLALMPTGGGKSICFQVPAMAGEGLCLVISPLIALMKDQVSNLRKRGINAQCIVSGMDKREIDIVLDNCVYGTVKFLYVSPERLATALFIERVKKMNVSLIAVDEAHCISQWGYDFRPSYLQIAGLRDLLPEVPVLALTATATPEVAHDITEKLRFQSQNQALYQKSFSRNNLSYIVEKEEDKQGRLIRICKRIEGQGIVYLRSRKRTRELATFLNRQGISAGFYHAGLPSATREAVQKEWVEGKIRMICATNAFGMGIDKADVRTVVHLDVPDSPEAYFQEAGRAGRDEKKAYAVLLWNGADLLTLDEQLSRSFPEPELVKRTYLALANYYQLAVGSGLDVSFDFDLSDFCTRFNLVPSVVYNCLKLLELDNYLLLSDSLHQPSRLRILVSASELYNFQVANRGFDPLLNLLIRSYSGLFDDFSIVRETEMARRLRTEPEIIQQQLRALDERQVVAYLPKQDTPRITYIRERVGDANFRLSPEVYAHRKKAATTRVEAMKRYIEEEHRCRSLMLLAYFGEENKYRCGICDYCLGENKRSLSNLDTESIASEIRQLLEKSPHTARQVLERLDTHSEEKVRKVIRWLLDKGDLEMGTGQQLSWKGT